MYKVIEQEKHRNKSVVKKQYQYFKTKRKAYKFIKLYIKTLNKNFLGTFVKLDKTNFKYLFYNCTYYFEIVDGDFDCSPVDETITILKFK